MLSTIEIERERLSASIESQRQAIISIEGNIRLQAMTTMAKRNEVIFLRRLKAEYEEILDRYLNLAEAADYLLDRDKQ